MCPGSPVHFDSYGSSKHEITTTLKNMYKFGKTTWEQARLIFVYSCVAGIGVK